MPQTHHATEEVEDIYSVLDVWIQRDKATTAHSIICGDFNAHVGRGDGFEYDDILGANGPYARNGVVN